MSKPSHAVRIRPFDPVDTQAVIDLWKRCNLLRAWNDPQKDIDRKLRVNPELLLVAVDGEAIVGTVMAGYEGHRGWVNYLAVDPDRRRQGLGLKLMDEAEQRLRALGCPKINLQIRHDNLEAIAFYERIGYREDRVVSYGKRLERDDDS